MDDLDRAHEREEQDRAIALDAALRRNVDTEQPDEENGIRYCLDCGVDIPKARLISVPGAVRCVECKEMKERRHGSGL